MTLGKSVISSVKWQLAFKLAAQIANWIVSLIIIRILTPADYGLYALAGFFIGLLSYLNEFGLSSALIRQKSLTEKLIRSVAGFTLCINAAVFLVLTLSASWIAVYFGDPRIELIVRIQSAQFLLMAFTMVPASLLSREMRFRAKGAIDFSAMILNALVTLSFALYGLGVWALVYGSLAAAAAQAIGTNVAVGRFILPRFSFRGMREIFSFGATVTLTRVFWFLYTSLDTLIIGKILGTYLVGIYDVARQIAAMPMLKVSGVLNDVGYSAFSKVQSEPKLFVENYVKAIRLIALFAFPIFFGISVTSREIVTVVLGDNWLLVSMPLQFIALLIPFRMMNNINGPALMAIGRPGVSLTTTIAGTIILPLATLLGTRWGLDGVVVSWFVGYCVFWLIAQRLSLPVLAVGYSQLWNAIRDPLFGAALMYLFVEWIRVIMIQFHPAVVLVCMCSSGAAVFVSAMYYLNRQVLYEALGVIRN